MSSAILTLNAGSSSVKAALFDADAEHLLATGHADRIGPHGVLDVKASDGSLIAGHGDATSHAAAIATIFKGLRQRWPDLTLSGIGHRVVHGGADRWRPQIIDDTVISELDALSPFAPLHQPHNLAGIRAAMAAFPGVLQIACFDTAFHRNHPWVNDTFALPRALYEQGVRRYGFHGLSYEYIAGELARRAPQLAAGRVVVAHLGNGASMCAMQDGRSIASTMGFSALDGLPMGTRCGQLDPGVVLYLIDQKGMSSAEISDLLYKKSGLFGLSDLSNDMRVLETAGTVEATDAIAYFVFRCQREVGAMAAALGGIDALVFCGGIGENSRLVRARICERLSWMGIEIDHARNADHQFVISSDVARTSVLVLPTDEERVIARAVRDEAGLGQQARA